MITFINYKYKNVFHLFSLAHFSEKKNRILFYKFSFLNEILHALNKILSMYDVNVHFYTIQRLCVENQITILLIYLKTEKNIHCKNNIYFKMFVTFLNFDKSVSVIHSSIWLYNTLIHIFVIFTQRKINIHWLLISFVNSSLVYNYRPIKKLTIIAKLFFSLNFIKIIRFLLFFFIYSIPYLLTYSSY